MDTKAFKERCERVVLVDEMPEVSRLRQKVEGCYEAFGMCPAGEVVALDMKGNVNCLQADINNGAHLCEEDGSPCELEAEPSRILGVVDLLRNFMLENLTKKEGKLPLKDERKGARSDKAPLARKGETVSGTDYADEDLGVSHYLSESEKMRRRHRTQKDTGKG